MRPQPEGSALEWRAQVYQAARRELTRFVQHMVMRKDLADEIAQQAALKLMEAERPPAAAGELRAWLFRVAANLAIDHLRRASNRHEELVFELRARAEGDARFLAEIAPLQGSAEMSAIAREHLVVCFGCTLRNLSPEQACALLLVEIYGFSVDETAPMLGGSAAQADPSVYQPQKVVWHAMAQPWDRLDPDLPRQA